VLVVVTVTDGAPFAVPVVLFVVGVWVAAAPSHECDPVETRAAVALKLIVTVWLPDGGLMRYKSCVHLLDDAPVWETAVVRATPL
jgi:hypothetical protein